MLQKLFALGQLINSFEVHIYWYMHPLRLGLIIT